jgi:hypothetical protein
MSKRPRGKQQQQQLGGLGEIAAPGKGKQARSKAGSKKKAEAASTAAAAGQKTDYIHVRARRGQATDSHSLAERVLLPTTQSLNKRARSCTSHQHRSCCYPELRIDG